MNKENTNLPIKCGYCDWLINGLQHVGFLEHSCFQQYDDERHLLHIDDNNVGFIIEKNQSTDIQASNTNDIQASNTNDIQANNTNDYYNEALINAVYARRALYDHRLPIKERTSLKKKALWNEVANLMGENDIEFIQKRWKQLRDSYVKAKKKENAYVPSGSSGSDIKNYKMTFALYNQMKFLDDVIGKSSTVTSLPDIAECPTQPTTSTVQRVPLPQRSSDSASTDSWSNISDVAIDDSSSCKTQSSKKRKAKEYDDSSDVELTRAIISSIEESKNTPDAVDGFFLQIGSRLRALPSRERTKLEIKILTDLFELENSLSLY